MLAALTVTYRDLYVAMDQMHKKDNLGIPYPLVDDPPAARTDATTSSSSQYQSGAGQPSHDTKQPATANPTQTFYPVRDFTQLPDKPQAGLRSNMQGRFMDKLTSWQQLLPNHLEVSYQLTSFVHLWPAMEAYYPLYLDVESAMRFLDRSTKRPGRTGARKRRTPRNRSKHLG